MGKKITREKKIMTEIVATTNIVASQGPERQPTATVMSGGCLEVVERVSERYLEGVRRTQQPQFYST